MVHYVSYGTPGGEYSSECRAAVVAAVVDETTCDLVVLNPTGMFLNRCAQDEDTKRGGTWHWPERVES
jgi:hypothetical protein